MMMYPSRIFRVFTVVEKTTSSNFSIVKTMKIMKMKILNVELKLSKR